jgi:acetyl esterase/lipase
MKARTSIIRNFTILLRVPLMTIPLVATRSFTAQTPLAKPPQENSQSSTGPFPGEQVSVQQDVLYGSLEGHPLLLDIYEPAENTSAPLPAVVLIHGGGWISFNKSTMRTMGMFLARSGFVAFSVDYRLFHGTENQWPAQLDDVQRAVRWIRANAAKYHVDADHIGAFGHSAGAQLAALLGMEDTRDNSDPALAKYSSKVQAVVDVSGPSDFTTNRDPDGDAFLTSFLGGDYAGHAKLWQDASPAFHIAKTDSPFLIVHGTQDDSVPIAQAEELADKLKQVGVPVKFVKVEDIHTFRTPEARKQLALETMTFFMQYLRPGK